MAAPEPLSMPELGAALDDAEHPKKLAILGLPWDTTEETLRDYFYQFGELEHAEVVKDRYTGKSRGFGFVTYQDASSATAALSAVHLIDGRRCEAKAALPKGDPSIPRTTRIFVARIPPSVTEQQFRSYFESFGKLQDAYMPKDHSKQTYRGIGFVTFTSPDSVEKIMSVKHWMNGHEIAIDRANPKEDTAAMKMQFQRPLSGDQRRSFDNGAGIIGPGLTSIMQVLGTGGMPGMASSSGLDGSYQQLRAISEESDLNGGVNNRGLDQVVEVNKRSSMEQSASITAARLAMGMLNNSSSAAATLQSIAKQQGSSVPENLMSYNGMQGMGGTSGLHNMSASDLQASLLSNAFSKSMRASLAGQIISPEISAAAMQQLMVVAAVQNGRRSLDSTASQLKRLENPAIMNARHGTSWLSLRGSGPRIFIGKLTKETSEADVKEYFMRFGYVMDVYMPKSKDNKSEHRGFGFVTFETEAAIQRVVSHGSHRLKGSTIAIDIAMPKIEEENMGEGGSSLDHSSQFHSQNQIGMPSLGMLQQMRNSGGVRHPSLDHTSDLRINE